jgi:hypothetical protein
MPLIDPFALPRLFFLFPMTRDYIDPSVALQSGFGLPRWVMIPFVIAVALLGTPPNKVTRNSPPVVDKALQTTYRKAPNTCLRGIPFMQGKWKYVGQSRVAGFSDELNFNGTEYTETISGGVGDQKEEGTLIGSLKCVEKNRIIMQVKKATPEGVFGNRSGDDYPCDVLTPVEGIQRKPRVLLVCYVDWDLRTEKGLDLEFQRVDPAPAEKEAPSDQSVPPASSPSP